MEHITPIFLVAPVRSGSTFLKLMLNSHPDIIDPGECDFLFDRITDHGNYPDLHDYLEWLKYNRIFLAKNLNIDMSLGFKDLIDSFIVQLANNKKYLVMNLHHHFYRVPFVFPNAKYIHLNRDPRDVARSCIGMGWVGNVYYGVDIWVEAEKSWDMLKTKLKKDQYVEIKYEDVLDDVENNLSKVCEFIGVNYTDQMMDYVNNSNYGLPDKSLSNQWKVKYNKRELALVEYKARDLMVKRGYQQTINNIKKPNIIVTTLLYLQNKYIRIKNRMNKYGFSVFIVYSLANKLRLEKLKKHYQVRINETDAQRLK